MGYMRHHAILVTTCHNGFFLQAKEKAENLFPPEILRCADSVTNGYQTIVVTPDGSKEGWEESSVGDAAREQFLKWLEDQRCADGSSYYSWVCVQYGDDGGETKIVDSDTREGKADDS